VRGGQTWSFRHLSATAGLQPSPEVIKLADQICDLKLIELKHLNDLIKDRLGLPDFGAGMPMMAAPMGGAAAAAAPAEEAEAEAPVAKTKFTVKLTDFDKIMKIKLIKEIREITKLGLKEAKDCVDKLPSELLKDVSRQEADEAMEKLKAVGAVCALE